MNSKSTFSAHATLKVDGKPYLSPSDFKNLLNFSSLVPPSISDSLFKIADSNGKGYLSLDDFIAFDTLVASPDAEFKLCFKTLDMKNAGSLSLSDIKTSNDFLT